jgi:ADP-heptose:LPS heptosyltransferase
MFMVALGEMEQVGSNRHFGESLPQRVAIVRALPGLGDFLCLVPALRTLRAALPAAQITLISLPGAKDLSQRFPQYLDQILEFPGYPGIPEVPSSPQRILAFLSDMQAKFDLALQLHGNGCYMNGFTLLLGATESAGFFPPDFPCPGEHFLPYPAREPEIWRNLRLLEFLGMPLQGTQLEFPLWATDWQEFAALAQAHKLSEQHYICIHPGASVSDRCWSIQQFAVVADALAAQGWQIVLTGTTQEKRITQAIAQFMRFPVIDLAGQTSLGAIAALLAHSRLLICNDTGVSHLAAALQVNSVVIFTHSDPLRWAPLDRQRHRIVIAPEPGSEASSTAVLTEVNSLLHPEVAYAS